MAPAQRRAEGADSAVSGHTGAAQIKQAYRREELKFHPDKFKGTEEEAARAEQRFKQINLAHTLLSDPAQRRQHDAGGGAPSGRRSRPAYSTGS